jgi:GAF domain-containing protein
MLRAVASLLAVELGQYCIADIVDRHGSVRRVEIGHADASRRAALRVSCEDADPGTSGRIDRLLGSASSEIMPRVTESARNKNLADLVTLPAEVIRSYMAASISVAGSPMAVLSLVVVSGTRRYDEEDLAFLVAVADWIGLGLENALRRELEPRASGLPPAAAWMARAIDGEHPHGHVDTDTLALSEEAPISRRAPHRRS